MKKHFALLLASVLLVFALTACGGDSKDEGNDAKDPVTDSAGGVTGGENDGTNSNPDGNANGNTDGNTNGSDIGKGDGGLNNDPADTNGDGLLDDLDGDGVRDSLENSGGETGTADSAGGVSYSQMLRNARVHDTDGDLTDYENSVTPGWR